jgi:hypothetical protein
MQLAKVEPSRRLRKGSARGYFEWWLFLLLRIAKSHNYSCNASYSSFLLAVKSSYSIAAGIIAPA